MLIFFSTGTSTTDGGTSTSHQPSGATTLVHSITTSVHPVSPWSPAMHTKPDHHSTSSGSGTTPYQTPKGVEEEEEPSTPVHKTTSHSAPDLFTWGPHEESSPVYPRLPERLPPVQMPPAEYYPPTAYTPRVKSKGRINSEASEYTAMIIGMKTITYL